MSGANGTLVLSTRCNFSGLNPVHSAVEAHFLHPHGRPWAEILDQVHPLMAEIVGKSIPEKDETDSDGNLRGKGGRSLRNGNSDRKSPLDDVAILQAHTRAVQTPLRGESLPFRSG